MLFRTATPEDVLEMARVVNAAYRGIGGRDGWTTESHLVEGMRTTPEELAAMMRVPETRFELAFDVSGELLGSVFLQREEGGSCYLGMLSVDPARQAGGVGGALVLRGEEIARAWGCDRLRISVIEPRVEVIAYYERRGFARTGRTEPFPMSGRSRPKVGGLRMLEMVKSLG